MLDDGVGSRPLPGFRGFFIAIRAGGTQDYGARARHGSSVSL